jgi:hypothetical protein
METNTLNFKYSGRRELSSLRKRTMYIYAIFLILIGMLGLYRSNFELNPFWYILTVGGILNIIHGIFGKELIKEKNFISIRKEEIEYKNSFKKPRQLKITDLLDLRIETAKVEFVHNDQRVESYNFSVFQRQELDTIYQELERIKLYLVK